MNNINLEVQIEQVNENISSSGLYSWDFDRHGLNEVVDANTEFKNDKSDCQDLVTPEASFALNQLNILSDQVKQSKPLKRSSNEYESTKNNDITDFEEDWKRVIKSHSLPEVHSYKVHQDPVPQFTMSQPNHLHTNNWQKLHSSPEQTMHLVQYPSDQISVSTEKRSFINNVNEKADLIPECTSVKDLKLNSNSNTFTRGPSALNFYFKNKNDSVSSSRTIPVTSNQISRAFHTARNNVETASNISDCSSRYDVESNYSGRSDSISTISDVSGYEEEMFRIKRLLLQDSQTSSTRNNFIKDLEKQDLHKEIRIHNTIPKYAISKQLNPYDSESETKLQNLTVQLQSALEEKEKCRLESQEAVRNVSLYWEEKYQETIRQKAHLEGRLEVLNSDIASLQAEKQKLLNQAKLLNEENISANISDNRILLEKLENLSLQNSTLVDSIREKEKVIYDINTQNEILNSEKQSVKKELEGIESENEKLRIEIQELKIDLESKDGVVEALKHKVAEQHVDYQSLLQAKLQAESITSSLKIEIDSVRKSSEWYRNELHSCQAAKVKVQQELMGNQGHLLMKEIAIEKLKGENAQLKQQVDEMNELIVKEKKMLLKKLEAIQEQMLEQEIARKESQNQQYVYNNTVSKPNQNKLECSCNRKLTDVLDDKEIEIISHQKQLQIQEEKVRNLETENAQLLSRITVLQKSLNDSELKMHMMDSKYSDMKISNTRLSEDLRTKDEYILELRNQKVVLEVALSAASKEKLEVDSAINKLKEDFAVVSKNYNSMKNNLKSKQEDINRLVKEISELKLLYNENLNKLEKEQSKGREMKERMNNLYQLENQTSTLENKCIEQNEKINNFLSTHRRDQEIITKLKETLASREDQLKNQSDNIQTQYEELSQKEELVIKLKEEISEYKNKINSLNIKLSDLEIQNSDLITTIDRMQLQLTSANSAIEQFNLLCRNSEEEKYVLKKTLKDLENSTQTQVKEIYKLNYTDKMIQAQDTDIILEDNSSKMAKLTVLTNFILNLLNASDFCINQFEFELICSLIERQKIILNKLEEKYQSHFNSNNVHEDNLKLRNSNQDKIKTGNAVSYFKSVCIQTESCESEKTSVQHDNCQKEIEKFKASLRMAEIEQEEKHRRYELNVRTLLKKVKEHMRGRKVAEKELEKLTSRNVVSADNVELHSLKNKLRQLEIGYELINKQYEEQKKVAERNQSALLDLERERGKLVQSQDTKSKVHDVSSVSENEIHTLSSLADQMSKEILLQQLQTQIKDMEIQIQDYLTEIKELKKQLFEEKCESSQLKKQVSSLRVGLDTANDVIDTKKVKLGQAESWCEVLKTRMTHLQKDLNMEQLAHEECRSALEKVKSELEEIRMKDPILENQLKTLSYHLHQKNQEIKAMQEKLNISEERWSSQEENLQKKVISLQEEMSKLQDEMDILKADKRLLQTQCTELRTALLSSLEQTKALKIRLETYGCDEKDKLPDLTSSLPAPPSSFDEKRIIELLQQSKSLPQSKPLSNLESCLNSLKQEMNILQKQLAEKTSGNTSALKQQMKKTTDIKEI